MQSLHGKPTPRRARRERGAALILTVIVVMVLTTLGIAMVTFTTTEERTAATFRDSAQVKAVAEGGARLVQEMFRSYRDRTLIPLYSSTATADDTNTPTAWDYWGANEAAVETQLNQIGIWRKARAGASPARYTGASGNLFQPPFGSSWANVFGGTYSATAASDTYDLKFNCRNPSTGALITDWETTCWLHTQLNAFIDNSSSDWNLQTGRITDISFYGPPSVVVDGENEAYGITTVRITAEKRDSWPDGNLLARETVVMVIGDSGPRPSIMGNGDIVLGTNGNRDYCGDGCEQIHANGDVSMSTNVTGGEDPMVTSTGTISGGPAGGEAGSDEVTAPEINPWDITYKPAVTAELEKYYLVAARRLDSAWRDGDASTKGSAARACGNDGLSFCQDYNLEYDTSGIVRAARTTTDTPYMYKWDTALSEWTECSSGTSLAASGACTGGPTFSVTRYADTVIASTTDNADLPFNKGRVARTQFEIQSGQDGATVLVDGKFYKHGNFTSTMTIIAVGSIHLHSNTTWYPAMSSKAMWISGRDVYFHSDCCTPSGFPCPATTSLAANSGIIAAHEQIKGDSNGHLGGIMLAEHRVNHDTTVDDSTNAIHWEQGEHGYLCGEPDWPWALPTKPQIISLTTAAD